MTIAHAEELTALDQAIGDGDHGLNMKRGFEAVLGDADSDRRKAAARRAEGDRHEAGDDGRRRLRAALRHAVPWRLGKELAAAPRDYPASAAQGGRRGRGARQIRYRPEDHARRALSRRRCRPPRARPGDRRRRRTKRRPSDHRRRKAIRGRASFLGERSIGHIDPGARSSALLVEAAAGVF